MRKLYTRKLWGVHTDRFHTLSQNKSQAAKIGIAYVQDSLISEKIPSCFVHELFLILMMLFWKQKGPKNKKIWDAGPVPTSRVTKVTDLTQASLLIVNTPTTQMTVTKDSIK